MQRASGQILHLRHPKAGVSTSVHYLGRLLLHVIPSPCCHLMSLHITHTHTHTHTHAHTHTFAHTRHTHYSWFVYRHAKPFPQDIVKLPPYPESRDHNRGTTVLPYLEAFYQYNVPQADEAGMDAGGGGVTGGGQDRLFAEDVEGRDMFDVEGNSLLSVPSERSLDTMVQTKSRVSSQENGKCS